MRFDQIKQQALATKYWVRKADSTLVDNSYIQEFVQACHEFMLCELRNGDYPVGTKYFSSGKHPKECTVIDIIKHLNSNGEVVKTRYISKHEFMGQEVKTHDVCATEIARGIPF